MGKTSKKTITKSDNVKFAKKTGAEWQGDGSGVNAKELAARGAVSPSLKDLIAGKGEAVAKAVAEKMGTKSNAEVVKQLNDTTAKATKKPTTKPEAKTTKAKKPSVKKETVASFMRRLITEGKTNEEVFVAAKKEFNLDDGKRSYPSWYRSEMQRKKNAVRDEKKSAEKKSAEKSKGAKKSKS